MVARQFHVYIQILPDLVIIDLGINVWDAGVSQSTFAANLQSLITAIQTGAPAADILLVVPVPTNPSGHASIPQQQAVIAGLYQVQANYNLAVVDLTSRWVSYAISQAAGYYGDTFTHPDGAGYIDIAKAISK
jgi:lysophospholipase L1-like esterase